jgi:hypothetical protein
MLSITIFATIIGKMLPVSDATPLIGQQRRPASRPLFHFWLDQSLIDQPLSIASSVLLLPFLSSCTLEWMIAPGPADRRPENRDSSGSTMSVLCVCEGVWVCVWVWVWVTCVFLGNFLAFALLHGRERMTCGNDVNKHFETTVHPPPHD